MSDQQSKLIPTPASDRLAAAPKLGVTGTDQSELKAATPISLDQSHTEFASFQQGYFSQYISLADTKATWAFTIASGALVYFLSKDGVRDRLLNPTAANDPLWVLWLIPPIVLLVVSAACSFLVVVPRLSTSGEGIVFYGAVARRQNANEYVEQVASKSGAALTEARLSHCYDLSKICIRKYRLLSRGMWLGILGLIAAVGPLLMFGGKISP